VLTRFSAMTPSPTGEPCRPPHDSDRAIRLSRAVASRRMGAGSGRRLPVIISRVDSSARPAGRRSVGLSAGPACRPRVQAPTFGAHQPRMETTAKALWPACSPPHGLRRRERDCIWSHPARLPSARQLGRLAGTQMLSAGSCRERPVSRLRPNCWAAAAPPLVAPGGTWLVEVRTRA
jgi:hypothetical protein